MAAPAPAPLDRLWEEHPFLGRHVGPGPAAIAEMLGVLGLGSLDDLVAAALPAPILLGRDLELPGPASEEEATRELARIAGKNRALRSLIGQGYHGTVTPPVIRRTIFENPGWYTAYTPYQAEISQGRLEALLNFQTLVCDLTGLDVANASLLDEGTAAAEAVAMAKARAKREDARRVLVSSGCHPQTIEVVRTRAEPLGFEVEVRDEAEMAPDAGVFAVLLQNPRSDGAVVDLAPVIARAKEAGATAIVAADPMAMVLFASPGSMGADIAVGSLQRFGVPVGYGGPHPAFLAARENLKRHLPGRLVGVSKDASGAVAYRLSLQTREQHIRREKATSNICTAQVLLAVIASMFAVYHGPRGLRRIASRIRSLAVRFAASLEAAGWKTGGGTIFDTVAVEAGDRAEGLLEAARAAGYNLRRLGEGRVSASFDETCGEEDLLALARLFGAAADGLSAPGLEGHPLARATPLLGHPVFNSHHTETEMMRYIRRLEGKDLSLTGSMIPLGSCTMKLNAAAEMEPVSWPAFSSLHPFAPEDQAEGFRELARQLESWLAEITGFAAVSLQPNAGSQGEYAGLLAIRAWHLSRGDAGRDVCIIPTSAHGTNPASAAMVGFRVVPVRCRENGDIDLDDLRARAEENRASLAAAMVTYPSTHGVFETGIREICEIVHGCGGQVYMDGANLNAQVGLCRPGDIGADVCHLNLHKTFCIPHGGGGPGVGPIAVAPHLAPFLPGPQGAVGPVSAAPLGSASILVIPWMYLRMMGPSGLRVATQVAILNANYIASRLAPHFPVLFKGENGFVAHECIIDLRGFKTVTAEDVAKRLMDYGFHAPTLSWPVAGTLMIEPTESEPKAELDRFCDAMIAIRAEMDEVESGAIDLANNPLKNAPHTAQSVASDAWERPYGRERAAYPAPWTRAHKFWPSVGRVDNVFGDRNPFCTCPPVGEA